MERSFRTNLIDAIMDQASQDEKIVVLNADSARALCLTKFAETYPERMINVGISETDLIGTAAGLATTGLKPVVVGFSMFVAEKPYEQIRQAIAYPNLNVKIVATHSGLCVGQDGASHQCLEDISIMRTLPNFKVFVAADIADEKAAFAAMMAYDGPAYLRVGRDKATDIFEDGKVDQIGGCDILQDGSDVTLVGCGLMVEVAMKAAEELKEEGINAAVINAYCIKPLAENVILEYAKKTKAMVTVEDHSVIGGLGAAVAQVTSAKCPAVVRTVGVQDRFGESGLQDDLFEKYGLTAQHIVEEAKKAIAIKEGKANV